MQSGIKHCTLWTSSPLNKHAMFCLPDDILDDCVSDAPGVQHSAVTDIQEPGESDQFATKATQVGILDHQLTDAVDFFFVHGGFLNGFAFGCVGTDYAAADIFVLLRISACLKHGQYESPQGSATPT